jgi:hypothetical protein
MPMDETTRELRGPGWEERRDHRSLEVEAWARRAGAWSALELARAVFGPEVRVRLSPWAAPAPLRGLLELEVPFDTLPQHREREARFLALAARDEVVSEAPFLFVFAPLEPPAPGPGATRPGPTPRAPEGPRSSRPTRDVRGRAPRGRPDRAGVKGVRE